MNDPVETVLPEHSPYRLQVTEVNGVVDDFLTGNPVHAVQQLAGRGGMIIDGNNIVTVGYQVYDRVGNRYSRSRR